MKTLEELIALSKVPEGPQTLRVMLAELVGMKNVRTMSGRSSRHSPMHTWLVGDIATPLESGGHIGIPSAVPNYPADLSACRDAECLLDSATHWNGEEHHSDASEAYMSWVQDVIREQNQTRGNDDYEFLTASAMQRTIALILTLQKPRDPQD